MPAPTRPQIEAAYAKPTYTVQYAGGGVWVSLDDADVEDVSGAAESAGGENGLIFGAEATATAQIDLAPAAAVLAWERLQVRVLFGFDISDQLARVYGLVTQRSRDNFGRVSWQVEGMHEPISRTPVYSPLYFRRPASTATSASSVEDPSSPSYVGGLVNYVFWAAGGRPADQAGSYPNALFYYRCDQSIIVPEWSWVAGENAWDELGRIARACGLVIYQAADGVMTAQHALNLAGSGSYTFTRPIYKEIREEGSTGEKVAAVRSRYTRRALQPKQVVYEDTTPRIIAGLDDITLTLEFQQPVYDIEQTAGALPDDAVNITTTEGITKSMSAAVEELAAGRIRITITNETNDTVIVSRIQIRGRPIAPAEEGMVRAGDGIPEREVSQDTGVYVQSPGHVRALAELAYAFYGTVRPTRQLSGCSYDPDRSVGEAVLLTDSIYSLSAAPHRITAIRHTRTGALMDVDLVPTNGLTTSGEVFIIGTSYSSGDTRKVSF